MRYVGMDIRIVEPGTRIKNPDGDGEVTVTDQEAFGLNNTIYLTESTYEILKKQCEEQSNAPFMGDL